MSIEENKRDFESCLSDCVETLHELDPIVKFGMLDPLHELIDEYTSYLQSDIEELMGRNSELEDKVSALEDEVSSLDSLNQDLEMELERMESL